MSTKKNPLAEALDILKEIQGIVEPLQKSDVMAKDEDKPEMPPADASVMGDAPAPEAAAPAPEAEAPEAAAPEAPEAPEAGDNELSEAAGEDQAALAADAAALSDEQLEMMLTVLMDEHDKRSASKAPAAEAPAAPAAPAPMEADKSMADMHKALEGMKQEVEGMKKSYTAQIDKLTKELEDSKKRNVTIANKPSATGMDHVEVLEKSRKAPQRLSKSETVEFLIGLQRQGDKRVEVRDITTLNLIKTESDLASYQDKLKKRGIQLPEL